MPTTEPSLAELIDAHESIDWGDVPGISTPEAAAWTARLIEARRRQEGREGQDCPDRDEGVCAT